MLNDFLVWATNVGLNITMYAPVDNCVFVSNKTHLAWEGYKAGSSRHNATIDTRIIEGEKVLLTNV